MVGVRKTKYQFSYMPESETRGRQPALRPHVLQGCRMYRMCRQPHCHSPAHLSPQCRAASWHPVTRRPSYFSTLPVPPTLLKLSMHFVFHLLPAPARAALWMPVVSAGREQEGHHAKSGEAVGCPSVGLHETSRLKGHTRLNIMSYLHTWPGKNEQDQAKVLGGNYRHPIACDLNQGLNKMRKNIKALPCKALPQGSLTAPMSPNPSHTHFID